jgi:hypothetical protein
MKANNAWDSLIENSNILAVLVLSGLIDAGCVVIWIITQLLVGRFIFRTSLVVSSLDSWIVLMFQLIFAISTLAPVTLYVVRDVIISIRRLAKIQRGM